MTTWAELGSAKYAVLTSFKKDRTPVGSPVWLAPDGDRIVIWTSADSWKVKRIRRNSDITLQISDARGRTTSGDVLTGVAEVQDAAGTEQTRAVISRKYGLVGLVMVRFSKLVRGKDATVGLAISPKN